MLIYTVQPGDSLYKIAREYQTSVAQIVRDNGLTEGDSLVPGQALVLLFPSVKHIVRPGQSLYGIAQLYGVSVNTLYRNNPGLSLQKYIYPGQELVIAFSQQKWGSIDVGGYAYPYVDTTLMRETLPYMTYLFPFTYEITWDGELSDLEDEELLALAGQYGVTPVMSLSNLREHVGFESGLAHLVLSRPDIRQSLIAEILETLDEEGYAGLDVDFENVYPEDAALYAAFLKQLREQLLPRGYMLFAALAAKTSDDQKGLLFEGHDYKTVGMQTDAVLLMTYEWGYRAGPPMAVAPIPNVRQVLDYAVTRIPAEKILLGIPNYGYDWPLPYVQGQTAATSLSNRQALDLARRQGAVIMYSAASQAPYFHYTSGGTRHEVWFEDARSIFAKLSLVKEYGLRGVSYWNLMRPFPENWSVLNALYGIHQNGAPFDGEIE